MRPLRYSINVTLDGCCDHRAMIADEDLHRDTLLFGRVTYEMMEAAWRPLPLALAEMGLIDEYEFVVQPTLSASDTK